MTLRKTFTAAAVCAALSGCSATTTQGMFNKASGFKKTYDTVREIGGGKLDIKRHEDGAKLTMKWKI